MAPKPKVLSPVRPSAAVMAAYQKDLEGLLGEMQASLLWWLRAAYRKQEPVIAAADELPAKELDQVFRRLATRWQKRFDKTAQESAARFANQALRHTDLSLKAAMRRAGLAVSFKPTRSQRDAMAATVAENVTLIKSIPQQHLTQVQGILMRGITRGRDLRLITQELEGRYQVTRRRAAGIARDQTNKAGAVFTRVRYTDLGITEALWIHSSAGRHPRPSHVAMNGKRYSVAEGLLDTDEGRKILPGELINCRCVSRAIIPGL